MKTITYLAASLLSCAVFSPSVRAYEDYYPYAYDHYTHLSGNWGGLRTELAEDGVEFYLYYNAIYAGNVSGGLYSASNFASDTFFGSKMDLEKLIGIENTNFEVSGIYRQGTDLTGAVGSQYSVMQLVGGQTIFFYNMTLERTFLDDDLSFKFGRMTATDDFVGSPFYSYSLNNAVNGQIRAVLFDGVMTSYPFPVWGGRAKYAINDESTVQLGLFQLTHEMFNPDLNGVDFSIDGDDGLSVFVQYDWRPEIDGKPFRWYVGVNQTFGFDMQEFNSSNVTSEFTRFYTGLEYQVYRESPESDEGLTLFQTFAYTAQQEVAIVPIQASTGLNYKGLIPGRPDDNAVFFFTYGKFSDDYSDAQVAAGGSSVSDEMVFEAGYRFNVTKSTYIQPDIQYIVTPGGTGNIDNAVVLGVQFGASF